MMKSHPPNNDVRSWIIEWLLREHTANAVNSDFQEAFWQRFGGRRKETRFGAQTVYKAQAWLKKMYDEGTLTRTRMGLVEMGDGWPKWVWVYSLKRNVRDREFDPDVANRLKAKSRLPFTKPGL